MTNRHDAVKNPAGSRWAAYSLAAASSAGAAAHAEISYSGELDLSIAQFNSQFVDFDGDGFADIQLKNYVFGGGNYQGLFVGYAPGKVVGFFNGIGYASALAAGTTIDALATAGGPFAASMAYGANNPNAEFNNVNDAYIGLEFPIGGVSHFAWMRVSIDNAAGSFVLHDWAYETEPGAGIAAGAIPAPGALGLLAAGAAGLTTLRKRRA